MKQLQAYINEKLVLSKNTFKNNYKYFPKNIDEFNEIIYKLIEEREDQDIIDLNDIDTSKLKDMRLIFFNNKEIEKIDISYWNVSNVTTMSGMFWNCENLKYVGNLSSWDVSKVTDMDSMFEYCKKLKDVGDISEWKVSLDKTSMKDMFNRCGISIIPDWYDEEENNTY